MTKEQFYKWLEDPASMNAESIPQLKEIIKRFPYFAPAQMMLAKNLKQENHIDQQKQVQLAAIMAPSRQAFHNYLFDKTKIPASTVEEVVALEEQAVVQPAEAKQKEKAETFLEVVPKEEPIEVQEQEVIEPRFPDELIPEPVLYQIETADLPEFIAEENEEKSEPDEMSFAEWLDYTEGSEPSKKAIITSKQGPQKVQESKNNLELIDHFLTKQKEKPKKRAEFFNPHKVAAKSNADDFTVISETLANIYFEQEKYELAKQAYEALNLKYPEKSVYFAARLKAIHEILNPEE